MNRPRVQNLVADLSAVSRGRAASSTRKTETVRFRPRLSEISLRLRFEA
jgi:hypothetical protein